MPKSLHTREHQTFVAVFLEFRQQAGLTQVELARKSRENQTKISNIERGQRRVDLIELRGLCRAMGITLNQFVDRFEQRLRRR